MDSPDPANLQARRNTYINGRFEEPFGYASELLPTQLPPAARLVDYLRLS